MSNTPKNTVTADTLAKVLMLTPRRIQQLTSESVLTKEGRGKYPLVQNVQAYIKYWQDRAVGSDAENPNDLQAERTRLTHHQANIAELEEEELKGSLVKVEEVTDLWHSVISNAKTRLLSLPNKITHQIMAADDHKAALHLFQSEIYEALAELANGYIRSASGGDGETLDATTEADSQSMG